MKPKSPSKYQMRQTELEMKDPEKIEQVLTHAMVGHLGLYDGEEPYVVPFIFVYKNNRVYMHCALTGRKIDIMKHYSRVCFEVDEFLGFDPDKKFGTRTSYRSVLCFGTLHLLDVTSGSEYLEALEEITKKYEPGGELVCTNGVLVLRLDIDVMTGRERILD